MRDLPSSSPRGAYPDRRKPRSEPPEEITVRRDTLVRLCAALEEIISRMNNQVHWLRQATAIRRLRWICQGCGHLQTFTMPKPIAVAAPCPTCGSDKFEPAP